jgi:signal peptidase II
MPERSYRAILWTLALVGLTLDQVSKYGIFAWLGGERDNYVLFGQAYDRSTNTMKNGFELSAQFELTPTGERVPHVNQGALFGFLRDHKTLANGGFAAISLLAAAAIIYWSTFKSTARDLWLCSALGLILAGTLGNFYDRIVFNGVRDFLHWHYWFDWPVFNIADCCLVCGACLLLLQAFAAQPAKNDSKKESAVVSSVA